MSDIFILTFIMIINVVFYVVNILISSGVMRRCKVMEDKFDAIALRQNVIENKMMSEFKKLIEHLKP